MKQNNEVKAKEKQSKGDAYFGYGVKINIDKTKIIHLN